MRIRAWHRIAIDPSACDCLKRISYINCASVITRPLSELESRIDRDPARICGDLSPDHCQKVLTEIQGAKTVKKKNKIVIACAISI